MTKIRKILEFLAKIGSLEMFKILWNAFMLYVEMRVCVRKLRAVCFYFSTTFLVLFVPHTAA